MKVKRIPIATFFLLRKKNRVEEDFANLCISR